MKREERERNSLYKRREQMNEYQMGVESEQREREREIIIEMEQRKMNRWKKLDNKRSIYNSVKERMNE